jgi:hypothetical protein
MVFDGHHHIEFFMKRKLVIRPKVNGNQKAWDAEQQKRNIKDQSFLYETFKIVNRQWT